MKLNKKHSFWLGLNYSFLIISSFINLKINLLNFGNEKFGIWIALASIWGIGSILDFGLGISVTKYIAQTVSESKQKISKLVSTSLFLFVLIGLGLFFVISLIGSFFYLNDTKIISEQNLEIAKNVFLILGFSFFIQYLNMFFRAVLEGFNSFLTTSRISMIATFLILVSTVSNWLFNLTLTHLALFYFVSFSIILCIYIFIIFNRYSFLKISLKKIDFKIVKSIFSFSSSVQATTLLGQVVDPVVKYIISVGFDISFLPAYELARKLSLAVTGLFHSSFRNLLPNASSVIGEENQKKYFELQIANVSRYSVLYIIIPFGLFLWVFPLFMEFWFNIKEASFIFLFLILAESINAFGFSIYIFYFATGKVYVNIVVQSLNLIIYPLILSTGFLINHNSWGFIGYAFSTLIANIFMIFFAKKWLKIDLKKFSSASFLIIFVTYLSALFVVSIYSYSFPSQIYWVTSFFSLVILIGLLINYKSYLNIIKNILKYE